MVFGLIMAVTSCSKDDTTVDDGTATTTDGTTTGDDTDDDTTTDDTTATKSLIDESGDNLEGAVSDMLETEGVMAAIDFVKIMDGEGGNRSSITSDSKPVLFTTKMIDALSDAMINGIDSMDNDSMDYHGDDEDDYNPLDHPGVYTYTPADSNEWSYDSTGTTDVIFHFPTKGSQTNNATLTVKKAEMETYDMADAWDEWEETVPTNVKFNLVVNNVKHVDVSFEATYAVTDSTIEPTTVDADVTVLPFAWTVDFDKGSSDVSLAMTFKKAGVELMGADISIEFADVVFDSEPTVIEADIHFFLIALDMDADFTTMDWEDSTMTINDVNDKMTVNIYSYPANVLLGSMEFAENPNDDEGDPIMTVTLANGKTITLEEFLTPIADRIQEFVCDNFMDENSDEYAEDCL